MLYTHTLETKSSGLYDITRFVESTVEKSSVKSGLCLVYCPHTTAGITINENADPDVKADMFLGLDKISPDRPEYRHREGNSPSHLQSSLIGPSQCVIIEGGKLLLGSWQGVFFCEFDGPRIRTYHVKIMPS